MTIFVLWHAFEAAAADVEDVRAAPSITLCRVVVSVYDYAVC